LADNGRTLCDNGAITNPCGAPVLITTQWAPEKLSTGDQAGVDFLWGFLVRYLDHIPREVCYQENPRFPDVEDMWLVAQEPLSAP
jgi:hypothetical protein